MLEHWCELFHGYEQGREYGIFLIDETQAMIETILSEPNLAHAYLLVANRPEQLSEEIELLFSHNPPSVRAFAHFLRPEEEKIDVEVTRDFRQRFTLQAVTELSLGIIEEADKMTLPAQQMLLKLLEEAPPRVVFILTTTKPRQLPLPLLSRVRVLYLPETSVALNKDLAEKLNVLFAQDTLLFEKQQLIEKLTKKYTASELLFFMSQYLWENEYEMQTLQKWFSTVSYVRHQTQLRHALEYFFLT